MEIQLVDPDGENIEIGGTVSITVAGLGEVDALVSDIINGENGKGMLVTAHLPDSLVVGFNTQPCSVCQETSKLLLPTEAWQAWEGGTYVQDAFPWLSADERELLITGTHSQCWDVLFPSDDDDDEMDYDD